MSLKVHKLPEMNVVLFLVLFLVAGCLQSTEALAAVPNGPNSQKHIKNDKLEKKMTGNYPGDDVAVRKMSDEVVKYDPTRVHYIAADSGPPRDKLTFGQALRPGAQLVSADRRWRLVYQTDGKLAAYPTVENIAFWTAGTNNSAPGSATLQSDGNLVLYDIYHAQYWSTGTAGKGIPPYYSLVMQGDRNIVIYDSNANATWASNTADPRPA